MTDSLFNAIYISIFGTSDDNIWWGNSLLFPDSNELQIKSLCEQALLNNALNSQGRKKIEEAIKKDLKDLKDVADITLNVSILSDDKISIKMVLTKPNNLQEKYSYIWNNIQNELIEEVTI